MEINFYHAFIGRTGYRGNLIHFPSNKKVIVFYWSGYAQATLRCPFPMPFSVRLWLERERARERALQIVARCELTADWSTSQPGRTPGKRASTELKTSSSPHRTVNLRTFQGSRWKISGGQRQKYWFKCVPGKLAKSFRRMQQPRSRQMDVVLAHQSFVLHLCLRCDQHAATLVLRSRRARKGKEKGTRERECDWGRRPMKSLDSESHDYSEPDVLQGEDVSPMKSWSMNGFCAALQNSGKKKGLWGSKFGTPYSIN